MMKQLNAKSPEYRMIFGIEQPLLISSPTNIVATPTTHIYRIAPAGPPHTRLIAVPNNKDDKALVLPYLTYDSSVGNALISAKKELNSITQEVKPLPAVLLSIVLNICKNFDKILCPH
jgi:hypothetical protein